MHASAMFTISLLMHPLSDNFPPVQNVMVTSVGANSVTVSWTVIELN